MAGRSQDGTRTDAYKRERVKKDNYLRLEGGFVGPIKTPMDIIKANAVPKFAADRPNLVAIADNMKVSPVGVPELAEQVNHEARRGGFDLVGGIAFIAPDPVGDDIVYRMQFVGIATAMTAVRIPREATRRLMEEEERSINDRKQTYYSPLDSL